MKNEVNTTTSNEAMQEATENVLDRVAHGFAETDDNNKQSEYQLYLR